MTRRNLFKALAGLPVVGKLLGAEPVGIPLPPIVHRLLEPSLAETVAAHGADKYGPISHYVGEFHLGPNEVHPPLSQAHPTIAEALEHVVDGRGDRIVVAPEHRETLPKVVEGQTFELGDDVRLNIPENGFFLDNIVHAPADSDVLFSDKGGYIFRCHFFYS